MEVIMQILVPVLTSLIAYFAAVSKANKELEAIKENNKAELEKVERQAKYEIEKLEKELENQVKLNESNAQIDIAKEFIRDFMKTPEVKKAMTSTAIKGIKK